MQERSEYPEKLEQTLDNPPSIAKIREVTIPASPPDQSILSITEVELSNNKTTQICLLSRTETYNVQSVAEIRNSFDSTRNHIAVMLDTNFRDSAGSNWIPIFKNVMGVKTLVARFDPHNRVLHIDHHLKSEEKNDVPYNQEFNSELPASTTPLAVALFRGLAEGTLYTEGETDTDCITALHEAWDAHAFMVFVDHFDPDSAESTVVVSKSTRDNIFNAYFDQLVSTTLDADHVGSYKHADGSINFREKMIKALSASSELSMAQTLTVIQLLEEVENETELIAKLEKEKLSLVLEQYQNFENKLAKSKEMSEGMNINYGENGNVLYMIVGPNEKFDIAHLTSLLKEKYKDEIANGKYQFCLVVQEMADLGATSSDGEHLHQYGIWLRTLDPDINLNDYADLLRLLAIYGRDTAWGNSGAFTHVTSKGLTYPVEGATELVDEIIEGFRYGKRWIARNPQGIVKTLEDVFTQHKQQFEIEKIIGTTPNKFIKQREDYLTGKKRAVAAYTVAREQQIGEQRVVKYEYCPPGSKHDPDFLFELEIAGYIADKMRTEGEPLVLIPEPIGRIIQRDLVGAIFEHLDMITSPVRDEYGIVKYAGNKPKHYLVSNFADAILDHIQDMRKDEVKRRLENTRLPVITAEKYKQPITKLAHTLSAYFSDELDTAIQQVIDEFDYNEDDAVLVNGRTKFSNMFFKKFGSGENERIRIGQTDWESMCFGNKYEDIVALVTNLLMVNPEEAFCYWGEINFINPEVKNQMKFLFVRKALTAIEYYEGRIKEYITNAEPKDIQEIEITRVKIDIHIAIIKWALNGNKEDIADLIELNREMRRLIMAYRPKTAQRDSQLYGYEANEL